MSRLPSLRNLSISVAAMLAIGFLFFGMDEGHMRSGMIAQLLAGVLVVALSISVGSYAHRKVWPDIRTHLFKNGAETEEEGDSLSLRFSSSDVAATYKLLAAFHRLIFILAIMFSMMWFLGNSGVS